MIKKHHIYMLKNGRISIVIKLGWISNMIFI